MEYKYEPIFGDQIYFEHQNNEYVVAFQIDHDDESFEIQFDTTYPAKLKPNETILAMRRIIPEPKRWTQADKDAGRLPEVGSFVVVPDGSEIEFVGESACRGKVALRHKSGKVFDFDSFRIKPIETPEEKAWREEEAFADSILELLVIPASSASAGLVKHTARVAYRKLKGGE